MVPALCWLNSCLVFVLLSSVRAMLILICTFPHSWMDFVEHIYKVAQHACMVVFLWCQLQRSFHYSSYFHCQTSHGCKCRLNVVVISLVHQPHTREKKNETTTNDQGRVDGGPHHKCLVSCSGSQTNGKFPNCFSSPQCVKIEAQSVRILFKPEERTIGKDMTEVGKIWMKWLKQDRSEWPACLCQG